MSGSVAAITLMERALRLEKEPSADRAETLIALGEATGRAGRLAAGQPYIEEALRLGLRLRERHHRGSG